MLSTRTVESVPPTSSRAGSRVAEEGVDDEVGAAVAEVAAEVAPEVAAEFVPAAAVVTAAREERHAIAAMQKNETGAPPGTLAAALTQSNARRSCSVSGCHTRTSESLPADATASGLCHCTSAMSASARRLAHLVAVLTSTRCLEPSSHGACATGHLRRPRTPRALGQCQDWTARACARSYAA